MKKSDLYTVSLKIFGLFLFFRVIIHIKDFLFMTIGSMTFSDTPVDMVYGGIIFSILIELAVGYILIFKTESVTNRISKSDSTVELLTSRKDLLEVGIAIIAIVLITWSSAELLSHFAEATYFHDHKESEYFTLANKKIISYAAFKLIAGIFSLMNSRHFSTLIIKRGDKIDAQTHES